MKSVYLAAIVFSLLAVANLSANNSTSFECEYSGTDDLVIKERKEHHEKNLFQTISSLSVEAQATLTLALAAVYWEMYFGIKDTFREGFVQIALSATEMFSDCRDCPQYRFLARPVYKALGGSSYPYISIPAAFVVTDFVMHQLPPQLVVNYQDHGFDFSKYSVLFSWPFAFAWGLISVPVVFNHMFLNQRLPSRQAA